jgi:antitoxin (DNA-binding transcriptional repressor) of toxin-antitoxin stability system
MHTISAGEFKTHCLKLMDTIAKSHEEYIVTKRGIPMVKIVPIENIEDPFGLLKGTVHISGDIVSESFSEIWEANQDTPQL